MRLQQSGTLILSLFLAKTDMSSLNYFLHLPPEPHSQSVGRGICYASYKEFGLQIPVGGACMKVQIRGEILHLFHGFNFTSLIMKSIVSKYASPWRKCFQLLDAEMGLLNVNKIGALSSLDPQSLNPRLI